MEIYYVPHNLYINQKAKIVIVGITPGWTQTEIAYRTLNKYSNLSDEKLLKKCKTALGFEGSMRDNLINMLNDN